MTSGWARALSARSLVPSAEPQCPTVAEVLGPYNASDEGGDIYIDEDILSGPDPENEGLLRETSRGAREGGQKC